MRVNELKKLVVRKNLIKVGRIGLVSGWTASVDMQWRRCVLTRRFVRSPCVLVGLVWPVQVQSKFLLFQIHCASPYGLIGASWFSLWVQGSHGFPYGSRGLMVFLMGPGASWFSLWLQGPHGFPYGSRCLMVFLIAPGASWFSL